MYPRDWIWKLAANRKWVVCHGWSHSNQPSVLHCFWDMMCCRQWNADVDNTSRDCWFPSVNSCDSADDDDDEGCCDDVYHVFVTVAGWGHGSRSAGMDCCPVQQSAAWNQPRWWLLPGQWQVLQPTANEASVVSHVCPQLRVWQRKSALTSNIYVCLVLSLVFISCSCQFCILNFLLVFLYFQGAVYKWWLLHTLHCLSIYLERGS